VIKDNQKILILVAIASTSDQSLHYVNTCSGEADIELVKRFATIAWLS